MKKLNNKGFVLAETIVVAVFVMTILTIIYVNFYPLIGEYEKREFYDDIDSKYDTYWFKRMIQSKEMLNESNWNLIKSNVVNYGYHQFGCNILNSDYVQLCNSYKNIIKAEKIYITRYNLDYSPLLTSPVIPANKYFKKVVPNSTAFDQAFKDYILYLPDYKYPSDTNGNYRVIIEFRRKINANGPNTDENLYYTFSTIEVKRQ